MRLPEKQITVISGHYGTGKTEFAVNLAFAMARDGRKTALADLDIVNPYFRSYERSRELEREGITVFVTSNLGKADIPALPPDIMSIFVNRQQQSIIDLGVTPSARGSSVITSRNWTGSISITGSSSIRIAWRTQRSKKSKATCGLQSRRVSNASQGSSTTRISATRRRRKSFCVAMHSRRKSRRR